MNVLETFSVFLFQRARKTQRRSGPLNTGFTPFRETSSQIGREAMGTEGKLMANLTKSRQNSGRRLKYLLEHTAYKKVIRKFTRKECGRWRVKKDNYMKGL